MLHLALLGGLSQILQQPQPVLPYGTPADVVAAMNNNTVQTVIITIVVWGVIQWFVSAYIMSDRTSNWLYNRRNPRKAVFGTVAIIVTLAILAAIFWVDPGQPNRLSAFINSNPIVLYGLVGAALVLSVWEILKWLYRRFVLRRRVSP